MKQYADTSKAKELFKNHKGQKEKFLEQRNQLLGNPVPAFYEAHEARVNADIARRPWAYDYEGYWLLQIDDELRAERREMVRKTKLVERVKKLEKQLAALKKEMKN